MAKRKRAKDAAASQPTKKTKTTLAANAPSLDKSPFCDNPTVDQRKREALLYELLGSEDDADRINAADAILSGLLAGDGAPEAVLERHLDWRLFRGLASGRNASRLGFSLVITEILRQLFGEDNVAAARYPGLSFRHVLALLVERTRPAGNIPGQEERDHFFGQLFGIECFVRAGILFGDRVRWISVLDLVLRLAAKKVWMRSQCGWIVVEAVRQMSERALAEETLRRLADEGLAKTPEGVGVWVAARDRFPGLSVPSKPWRDPLAPKALVELPAVLRDSGKTDDGRKPKQGGWSAQLHFVWDVLLAHYAGGRAEDNFQLFWTRVVDEGFFSKNASDSQKFSGFMILQKTLDGSPSMVGTAFSKNLLVCLMNQAAKEDRYLHRAALKVLKGVESAVQKEPALLAPVLRRLLGPDGSYGFDQRTNTKTVERLLQLAVDDSVLDIIKPPDSDPSSLQTYANYLFKLASIQRETTRDDGDRVSTAVPLPVLALQELAGIAYSRESADSKSRDALRSRLSSAFAKFVRRPDDFGHLCNAVLSIDADVGMDEDIQSELVRALERLRDLLDDNEAAAPRQGLALLHAVGILQLYNEDPDAVDTLGDLEQCYDKLGERDGVSEFLVEILLSMVAQPSSLMRQVTQQVLEAFTPVLSAEAVQLLTDPLAADENAKGQQALFSTEDEDVGGEEASLDSDVEVVEEEGDDGDDDEEDEDEDKDEDEDEDGEDTALDASLAEVLKSHRLDQDRDESSDSDMTDSEMMELDAKLVDIFRQRAKTAGRKREQRDAKESVANFKHRVLDLLAIFVRREAAASNPLVLAAVVPLLRLVRTTTARPLASKACEIVLSLGKGLKKGRGGEKPDTFADGDTLMALLADIHDEAAQDPSHLMARAASAASTAVAAAILSTPGRDQDVFGLYTQTQLRWFRGEARMQASFFSDWLNWCQSQAKGRAV